jgi:hypothetical protein
MYGENKVKYFERRFYNCGKTFLDADTAHLPYLRAESTIMEAFPMRQN